MADELKNTIAQSLECPVCLNIFKDPKILPCSHTFCKACLDNLLECHGNEQNLRCPVCRADTQVLNHDVSQLPTNLALKSLIEDVESKQPLCTNCNSEEKIQAVVYCQDCGSYLCINCQTTHSKWNAFSDHEVIAMSEIKSGKVPIRRFRKCRKHPREDEECFCCNCRRFACFRCGIMEHKDDGHRVIEASMYERNHLKTVQELKSKADIKLSCIQKYVELIDEQKDLVSTAKKQCIDDISDAYDESVRQLTEKKELLIGEVNSRYKLSDKDLDTMKEEAQQQITHINAITDLVANGTKIPMEMDALTAHDTLCQELQDTLMREDPDFKQPGKSSRKGKLIAFERSADVGKLGLGKLVNTAEKNVALSKENSMDCIVATPEGRMGVGCYTGGFEIFSSDGQLQQTVLKDVKIRGIGFLSDGRCAVRDTNNNINLYTIRWQKLDVRFETLSHEEGGYGDLTVDSDDQIYVGYRKRKEIYVFPSTGKKAMGKIRCDGYEPSQILPYGDALIIRHNGSTLSINDKDGNAKHKITKANIYPHATVIHDDIILIGWVNHDEGLVSIDEYNKELEHIKNIISDYKIEKPERNWYYLREFRSGEIAFCTPDRLYIFNLDM